MAQEKVQEKKGKRSWKPANVLAVKEIPGFRARWRSTDPMRMRKATAEGWVHAKDAPVKVELDDGVADNLNVISGASEYRELALMVLPEDLAEARQEYIEEKNTAQSITPASRARREMRESQDFIFEDEESLRRYK